MLVDQGGLCGDAGWPRSCCSYSSWPKRSNWKFTIYTNVCPAGKKQHHNM